MDKKNKELCRHAIKKLPKVFIIRTKEIVWAVVVELAGCATRRGIGDRGAGRAGVPHYSNMCSHESPAVVECRFEFPACCDAFRRMHR